MTTFPLIRALEWTPQELLDAALGFNAMDPPRDTEIRWLQSSAFTPERISRIKGQIGANAERVVDDIAHEGEIDFVHEVAHEAQLAKLQELM
jgi:cytochrome P450